jgi:hypothetical protein
MDKAPKFYSTIIDPYESEFNNSAWELVRKANDDKNHKTVFYQSLNYINKDSRYNETMLATKSLRLFQGGRPVDITWDDQKIYFNTTLLNYVDGMELAPLRKMSEFSFFDLKLVQLKIKGDKIVLKYEETWAALDPYKFFDVMEDFCNFGDFLESYMVKKFNLVSPNQKGRTPLADKDVEKAWSLFQEINKETKAYLDEFDKKRWRDSTIEVFWNYILKLETTFNPRGFLKLELKSALSDLNPNVPYETMYAKVATNFKKISEISKENFKSSFYKERSFMAVKRISYPERTKKHFDDYLKNAFQYRNKQDYMLTVLYLNTAIYSFLSRYFAEPELETYLRNLLKRTSGTDWKSASERLYLGLEKYIINQNLIYQEPVNVESAMHAVVSWFKKIGS